MNPQNGEPLPVKLGTNMLQFKAPAAFSRYAVSFEPEVDDEAKGILLCELLKEKCSSFVFDGSVIHTDAPLDDDEWVGVKTTIKVTGYKNFGTIREHAIMSTVTLQVEPSTFPGTKEFEKITDAILEDCLLESFLIAKGGIFFETQNGFLPREADNLPGYALSTISKNPDKAFLCVQIKAKLNGWNPIDYAKRIESFVDRFFSQAATVEKLGLWGIRVAPKSLTNLDGRLLYSVTLHCGHYKQHLNTPQEKILTSHISRQMLSSVDLHKWIVVLPQDKLDDMDKLVEAMVEIGHYLGMIIDWPLKFVVLEDQIQTLLENVVVKTPDLQLVLFALPEEDIHLYASIRKLLTASLGVNNHSISPRIIGQGCTASVATNLVMKMNAVLGGEPYAVDIRRRENLMFIGLSENAREESSEDRYIGATLTTLSKRCTKYISNTFTCHDKEEMVLNLRTNISHCIMEYQKENGNKLPDTVIVYREKCEGNLSETNEDEILGIKMGLEKVFRDAYRRPPELIFVVLQMATSIQLLLPQEMHSGVDYAIGSLSNDLNEFYLTNSPDVPEIVTPTFFKVLYNKSSFNLRQIQDITFQMCHASYSDSRTTSFPAPCHFAHKLASLACVTGMVSEKLSNFLHFL